MTGIEILVAVVLIVFIAAGAAHQFSKHQALSNDVIDDLKDIEVKAEEVANELYNKDLRPTTAKKTTKTPVEETKSEFPIDKPKKKRKYYPRKKK
jgi:type II secretory pathway pseudopilin PulG